MNKRNTINFRNFLEEAVFTGTAKVSKNLLVKGWQGQERISKAIWQVAIEKFPEAEEPENFLVYEWGDEIMLINKSRCHELVDLAE